MTRNICLFWTNLRNNTHCSGVISFVSADSSTSVILWCPIASAPWSSTSFKNSPRPSLSTGDSLSLVSNVLSLKLALPMLVRRTPEIDETDSREISTGATSLLSNASLAPKSETWASLSARSLVEYLKNVQSTQNWSEDRWTHCTSLSLNTKRYSLIMES